MVDFTIKSRTRSRDSLVHPNITFTTKDATCSSGTVVSALAGPYMGESVVMIDATVPGFWKLRRSGFTIVNSMTRTSSIASATGQGPKVTLKANSCSSPVKHKETDYPSPSSLQLQFGSASKFYPPATILTQSDIDSALSIAATAAWSDCRNNSADVLQDIAEYRQTLGLLKEPLGRTHQYLRSVWSSKLGRSAAGRALRGSAIATRWASDMWLRYRFGVRPLIGTVEGVAEALKRDNAKHRRTARGKSTVSSTYVETGVLQYPGTALGGCRSSWTRTHTDEVTVRCGVLLEEAVDFAGSIGVDASGLLALPWELLPYSFVADWFANTGTYLASVIPYYTKRPLQTWHSIERVRTVTVRYHDSYIPISTTATLNRGASEFYTFTEKTYSRAAGIPGPSITFRPKAVEGVVNSLRLVDSFALISNLIGKLSR